MNLLGPDSPGGKSEAIAPAIDLQSITKRFGQLFANDNCSFQVAAGTIHGIIGENGAGKSTIVKILYGLYQPDSGKIILNGRPVDFKSPLDAIHAGIGMVHQHFMLVPTLSVWQNICLGAEPSLVSNNRDEVLRMLRPIAEEFDLNLDWDLPVEALPIGGQQQVEILKLLYRSSRILILDEPTAVLTPGEVESFFARLKRLRDQGRTILIITHKLKEILAITSHLTVMRQGRVIGTYATHSMGERDLAEKMVGRDLQALPPRKRVPTTEPALRLEGLTLASPLRLGSAKSVLFDVNLEVAKGEIVGIAGVDGNGQKPLLDILAGLERGFSGKVEVLGRPIADHRTYWWKQNGVAFIPQDRLSEGVIPEMTAEENFLLGHHREADFLERGLFSSEKIFSSQQAAFTRFDVRPNQPKTKLRYFSGGNQQKGVFARELARKVQLLVAAHPTRGVDVGAIEFIHSEILRLREQGVGILLISSELDEVLALADRIVVLYEGHIQGACDRVAAKPETLGLWMAGSHS